MALTDDYIVIGSGSAGGTLTGRLSESGKHKVLCLEAGTRGAGHIWTRPPAGTAFLIDDPSVNWRYYSEPNETHGNRPIYVPRGKMLGGTSSINGTADTTADSISTTTLGPRWAAEAGASKTYSRS